MGNTVKRKARVARKSVKLNGRLTLFRSSTVLKRQLYLCQLTSVIKYGKFTGVSNYALNQWGKAIRYVDDGRLDIDNNRNERAIKPFVVGRKSWLFSKTANGANASATLYSIVETAKANGLIPYDYLMHVMDKVMHGETDPEQLLPWKVNLG